MAEAFRLGINVDHVATIRQARGTDYPDPVEAALAAERAGAEGITVHLREDRRHIQDHDVTRLAGVVQTKLNLEMAAADEIVDLACELGPADCCLVPERREELTTEGGLKVAGNEARLGVVVARLRDAGIRVSLFIDPALDEIAASHAVGADTVELHTGTYAEHGPGAERDRELERIVRGAAAAAERGLTVENVGPVAALAEITELNIGHSIVARAIFLGIEGAVSEMLAACLAARGRSGAA